MFGHRLGDRKEGEGIHGVPVLPGVPTQEEMKWVWVSLPYATFGLRIEGGVVVEAPPIARWAVGLPEAKVAAYLRGKGAVFARVNLN
jgi:hypothetical protein